MNRLVVPVSPARPSPVRAPVVDCVYIGEPAPRLPAPIDIVEAAPRRTVVVCGVLLGADLGRRFKGWYQ